MNNQLTPRINRIEPNVMIDGNFNVWPEGDTRTFVNNGAGFGSSLMRLYNLSSGVTITNSKDPSNPGFNLSNSNKLSKTASGSVVAGTAVQFDYGVEGQLLEQIYTEEFSIIFWVKSSVAATRTLAIRNSNVSHSYLKTYTINAANTWELKVLKFNALNTCPGILNRDTTAGIYVSMPVVAGSNYQTATTDQWTSGSFTCATGQDTTWLTGTNHDFFLGGMMIIPGDWTSLQSNPLSYSFIRAGRNFADEFNMISRYVEVVSGGGTLIGNGFSNNTTVANCVLLYKVEKRAVATVTLNNVTGFRYNNATNNYVASNVTVTVSGRTSAGLALTTSGISAGNIPGTFDLTTGSIVIDARI